MKSEIFLLFKLKGNVTIPVVPQIMAKIVVFRNGSMTFCFFIKILQFIKLDFKLIIIFQSEILFYWIYLHIFIQKYKLNG